jgi:hypothetical protein
VRVEFAGHVFTSEDELNGIAFQGVGNGTEVDFVQVHRNKDDGIEMFGGSVDIKHGVVTGCVDDQFDWTYGWNGNAQFVVIQLWDDAADRGFEADNNKNVPEGTPVSHPVLANFTIVGGTNDQTDANQGMLFRRGTEVEVYNSIVTGHFGGAILDVDDDATFTSYTQGDLVIEDTMFWPVGTTDLFDEEGTDPVAVSTIFNSQTGNTTNVDPALNDPFSRANPDFRPQTTLTGGAAPAGPFFDNVTYKGAMDETTDWTAGWTTHASN